jgi:hypothetical protein
MSSQVKLYAVGTVSIPSAGGVRTGATGFQKTSFSWGQAPNIHLICVSQNHEGRLAFELEIFMRPDGNEWLASGVDSLQILPVCAVLFWNA